MEKLKGEQSFFKPFLDYLPERNDTLFTFADDTPISNNNTSSGGGNGGNTLQSEVQNPNDDLFKWIAYDRDVNEKAY